MENDKELYTYLEGEEYTTSNCSGSTTALGSRQQIWLLLLKLCVYRSFVEVGQGHCERCRS